MREVYIPSNEKFNWEQKNISKEVLRSTVDKVQKMNASEVLTWLDKYKDINLWHDTTSDTNSFEMVALYQRAINLSWWSVTIDGRFWTKTYTALKSFQETLWITGVDKDGFPGNKTTAKIIEQLVTLAASSKEGIAPTTAQTETQSETPALETTKEAQTRIIKVGNKEITIPDRKPDHISDDEIDLMWYSHDRKKDIRVSYEDNKKIVVDQIEIWRFDAKGKNMLEGKNITSDWIIEEGKFDWVYLSQWTTTDTIHNIIKEGTFIKDELELLNGKKTEKGKVTTYKDGKEVVDSTVTKEVPVEKVITKEKITTTAQYNELNQQKKQEFINRMIQDGLSMNNVNAIYTQLNTLNTIIRSSRSNEKLNEHLHNEYNKLSDGQKEELVTKICDEWLELTGQDYIQIKLNTLRTMIGSASTQSIIDLDKSLDNHLKQVKEADRIQEEQTRKQENKKVEPKRLDLTTWKLK